MSEIIAARVLKKLHDGDSITTAELNRTIEFLKPVVSFLFESKERHFLGWLDLHRDLLTLEGYQAARERDKK